jgi:hypothetical protein
MNILCTYKDKYKSIENITVGRFITVLESAHNKNGILIKEELLNKKCKVTKVIKCQSLFCKDICKSKGICFHLSPIDNTSDFNSCELVLGTYKGEPLI